MQDENNIFFIQGFLQWLVLKEFAAVIAGVKKQIWHPFELGR